MALPKKSDDPILAKMLQAHKLMQEAYNELGNRNPVASRSIARSYLKQAMYSLRRATDYESRAM